MEVSPGDWLIEETAECGMCLHIANVSEFIRVEGDEEWSECPECGMPEDSPPMWDEEDIARYKASVRKWMKP